MSMMPFVGSQAFTCARLNALHADRRRAEKRFVAPPVVLEIPKPKRSLMSRIIAACAEFYGVTARAIKSKVRKPLVVTPRHIAMYLAKKFKIGSLATIARCVGRSDHSTTWHAVRKIARLIECGSPIAAEVVAIEAKISMDDGL